MWTPVTTDEDIQESIEIMKGMDRNYQLLTVTIARHLQTRRDMFAYLFRGEDIRIVLVFARLSQSKRIRIYTAGYDGVLSPSDASNIAISKIIEVLAENGLQGFLTAIRNVDHEPLNLAIESARRDSRLRFRIRASNEKFILLEGTTAGCSDKSCVFEWTGTQWGKIIDDCKSGCTCDPPDFEGTYLGQQEIISCHSAQI